MNLRTWKAYGITHVVYQSWGANTVTACGELKPDLPWRNASRFSLEKINCMGCIAAMSENV